MSNHALPTLSSTYTNFLTEMSGRVDDAVKQSRSDTVVFTNPPIGAIRWNTAGYWQTNTGTVAVPVWSNLATTYDINVSTSNAWATGRTIALTADVTGTSAAWTGSGNISFAATLATVNANVGAFGSATTVPILTVNAKGLVTAVSTAALGSIATQSAASVAITGGAISATTLTLVGSTTAAPTVEGRMEWDTDNDQLKVGNGTAATTITPDGGAATLLSKAMSTGCTWGGTAIPVANGGTGSTTAATARTALGVGTLGEQSAASVAITGGAISGASLTLVGSISAAPTVEGRMEWDTDNDVLVIGDGVTSKAITPDTGATTLTNKTMGTGCTWGGSAVPIANGGTGTTSVALALTAFGLNNVNNTSDASKPVSTAQQTALGLKSNLASPTFTGVPAAPTAVAGTNTTQLATTAFVQAFDDADKANLASPTFTGVPAAPTAVAGTNTTQLATTAFVQAEIAADAPTKTGGGASGSWAISVTGNAATATALATTRSLTIGSTGKNFDGSAAVSWSLAEIGAAAAGQTMYIGTTALAINRASAAVSLTGTNIDGSSGSCTGNAATSTTAAACSGNSASATLAVKASTLSAGGGNGTAMTFSWAGQSGQPAWLWGGSDGSNMYVYNPSNFSVNYANTAGNGGVTSVNGQTGAVTVSATPTTGQVTAATAGAAAGQLGTYALLRNLSAPASSPGATFAGSSLTYTNASGTTSGSVPSGTWRLCGELTAVDASTRSSLWLRIA